MEAPKQSDFSPSDRIFKWWTIITLAVNIAISALIFSFLTVGLGKVRETRGLMDMLILFYHMVREAGGIIGAIYLLIFGSNAVLLGRILYDEKVAVRAVMLDIGIKSWTVLIILIDIAAIVFPFLTMVLRHPGTEGSHAAMAGEVYSDGTSSSGLTADTLLYLCIFLWTLIFTSNTLLLFRSLCHKCDRRQPKPEDLHWLNMPAQA
ncbi:MAG: hypothetical protein ACYTDW_13680 [Planctomycetota bacterium]|jgi:hypothetical protein